MDGYKNMIDIFKKLGLEVDYKVLKEIKYKAIEEYNIREEERRQNESAIKEVQEKFKDREKASTIIIKLVNDENGVYTDNGRKRVLMKLFEEMGIFHLSSNSEVKKYVTPWINDYIERINKQRQPSQMSQIALENLQNFEVNKACLIASDNRRSYSSNAAEEIARKNGRQVPLLTSALILANKTARTNNIQRSKETQKQSTTPQTQDGMNEYYEQHQRETRPFLPIDSINGMAQPTLTRSASMVSSTTTKSYLERVETNHILNQGPRVTNHELPHTERQLARLHFLPTPPQTNPSSFSQTVSSFDRPTTRQLEPSLQECKTLKKIHYKSL